MTLLFRKSYPKPHFSKETRPVFMHLGNRFRKQQVILVDCLPTMRTVSHVNA